MRILHSLHDRQLCLSHSSENHHQLVENGFSKFELWRCRFDVFSCPVYTINWDYYSDFVIQAHKCQMYAWFWESLKYNTGKCLHSTLNLWFILMILKWVFEWDLRDFLKYRITISLPFLIDPKKVSDCFRFHYVIISMLGKQPSIQMQYVF